MIARWIQDVGSPDGEPGGDRDGGPANIFPVRLHGRFPDVTLRIPRRNRQERASR
jgi:hypothetical protein